MTDLKRLKVSLTKHGAYKIALLLRDLKANEILKNLSGSVTGINIEEAQVRKNMSISDTDVVPDVWDQARKLGPDAIDALVLLGIIFSHSSLIEAMAGGALTMPFTGRIVRGQQLSGKEFTNFRGILDGLGYATKVDEDGVSFDLRHIFEINGLNTLARDLISLKLVAARWDQSNSLEAEVQRLRLHRSLSISKLEFTDWLRLGIRPASSTSAMLPKDEEFFSPGDDVPVSKEFKFVAGHVERAVVPVSRAASSVGKASRLHNDIQNRLYLYLCAVHGKKCVGTEQDTGAGTAIDVVTRVGGQVTFYEIKTSVSVKASIRQAIPQLLEYCYWPDSDRAARLVIVSHLPITKDAATYLAYLRDRFKVPLSYEQFCLKTNALIVT